MPDSLVTEGFQRLHHFENDQETSIEILSSNSIESFANDFLTKCFKRIRDFVRKFLMFFI